MRTYKSESDDYPAEWDASSSRVAVYHNYNAVKTQKPSESEENGAARILYAYDVDEYAKDEYIAYMSSAMEKSRRLAAAAFTALAQGVDSSISNPVILEHADVFPVWDKKQAWGKGAISKDGAFLYRALQDIPAGKNAKPSKSPEAVWEKII